MEDAGQIVGVGDVKVDQQKTVDNKEMEIFAMPFFPSPLPLLLGLQEWRTTSFRLTFHHTAHN